MKGVPRTPHPDLLIGPETADDAGVYRINDDLAVVQTVDVFTPVVDDPFTFGQIVAANSMSDVWAMGGRILTVLNLLGFPDKKLAPEAAAEIMKGCGEKVAEAGGVICGGHTWIDPEVRAGLSVTGIVHPNRIIPNTGAKAGDVLVLTKALGTGILSFAKSSGFISDTDYAPAIKSMVTLNKTASEVMVEVGVHACTDITGFSLLGHGFEMAGGSGLGLVIEADKVPVFESVKFILDGESVLPLAKANRLAYGDSVAVDPEIPEKVMDILYDPQTSGGLLITLPANRVTLLLDRLQEKGCDSAKQIGHVVSEHPGQIKIIPSR